MAEFKVIQITKINTTDFTFLDPDNVTYPVDPLVSVKLITPEGGEPILKIRATLYINSKNTNPPKVKSVKENGTILTVKFECDFTKKTPETCDVWYIELNYTSATANQITEVDSFLKNNKLLDDGELGDPESSKGTKIKVED